MSPEHRVKQGVKLTFPPHPVREPVIHSIHLRPEVVTDIHRAGIDGDSRWVVSGLKGEADDSEHDIARVTGNGVAVDPVIGDTVRG